MPALCALAVGSVLLSATACSSAESAPKEDVAQSGSSCAALDPSLAWYGDNRVTLDAMMTEFGTCGAAGDVDDGAPLALFDWDNTVVKNDIGSATAFWMIKNNKVLQPAGGDWATTSRFMTPAGAAALSAACGSETAPGQPLATSTDSDCADEIVAVLEEKTRDGQAAFDGYDHRRTKAAYAWAVQLMAGHTEDEITEYARAARAENLAAAEGSDQTVGTTEVDGSVRYYAKSKIW